MMYSIIEHLRGQPLVTEAHQSILHVAPRFGKEGDRTEVIKRYCCWLWEQLLKQRGPVHAKLLHLKNQASVSNLTLICWCSPLPCHAEVIESCVEWVMTPGYEQWLERQDRPPVYTPDWSIDVHPWML